MSDRSRLLDRPDGWRVVSWRRPRIGNAGFARAGTATKVTSIPSRSYRGIQPLQFYAGIGGGEVPIGFDLFFFRLSSQAATLDQDQLVGNTPIEPLTRQYAPFGFSHVQPTAVFWGVVPLELFDEPAASLPAGRTS